MPMIGMASPFVVLVTGAGGQLGQELVRLPKQPDVRVVGLDRRKLDVIDRQACMQSIASVRPDAVIHAAAYTAVDRAEAEPDMARLINVEGTRYMAEAAESAGAKFVYISTDYVFDGHGRRPYRVDDPTAPRSVYGRTKLAGERAALAACSRPFVVRTSWVYGAHGANFVKTMLKLGRAGQPLRVVEDQVGSPTYTYDLADTLMQLARTDRYGVYHAAGGGSCSWYHFARTIFELCGMDVQVSPCSTGEYPRPAPRPAYSVLDCESLPRTGIAPPRHWREALAAYLCEHEGLSAGSG